MLRAWIYSASALALLAQAPVQVRVVGRILGPDVKPVAGAVVALVPASSGSGLSPIRERRADAKGHFTLEGATGTYGLTVTAPGCLPHFRNLELKAEIPLQPLEIRLEKGGCRIKGRVCPAPGSTLEDARLGFSKVSQDSGDQFFGEVRKGRFDITLAAGTYLAFAQAKGQVGSQRIAVPGTQSDALIQLQAEPTPADPKTLDWIKRNAIPLKGVEAGKGFADMQPLKVVVGDARVVALGEATHGSREFFQLKHRMLEFLATEMGFTVFALEANLPEAFAVNDYVLTGKGDPARALAGLYFWTWNTEEVLDLIRWMRAYNEDPAHTKKLHFYGVDMQTETVAYAQAKAWLEAADPVEASHLLKIKEGMVKLPSPYAGKLNENGLKAWASVAKEVEALIIRLETRKLMGEDFDRQRQNLRVLGQFAAMQADPEGGTKVRDESMAANLRWIQSRERGAKVVFWAHNGHIRFNPGSEGGANSVGWHLRQNLRKAYLPIGFAFAEGGFHAMGGGLKVFEVEAQAEGTLDAALAATQYPFLALDLRGRPKAGPVKRWLESPQGTWRIGSAFSPDRKRDFIEKASITEAYDALLFVNRTTHARPVPIQAAELKEPVNLGFENGLQGWSSPDFHGYQTSVVTEGAKDGAQCLRVNFVGAPNPNAWWKTEQSVDAARYRGRRVSLKGWIRTDGKPDFKARFWMRVDGKKGRGFYDNMEQRPVTATEWTEVAIEGPVAEDAVNLTFGCTVMGAGSACFDGIRLEVLP